jgi:hypothetical protein
MHLFAAAYQLYVLYLYVHSIAHTRALRTYCCTYIHLTGTPPNVGGSLWGFKCQLQWASTCWYGSLTPSLTHPPHPPIQVLTVRDFIEKAGLNR